MGKSAAFGMMMWMAGVLAGLGAASLDAAFWAGVVVSLWSAVYYARLIKATDT